MRYFCFLILIFLYSCQTHHPQQRAADSFVFYVGTYTQNTNSKGIYKYELSKDGSMKKMGLMAKTENPSYLAKSINGKFLIVVNETSDDNKEGSLESYKIFEDSLILMDKKSSGGAHPCHVSINSDGYVVVSNYTGGNVALLKLNEQGKLLELDVQQHAGTGTDTIRQEGPHAHSAYFYPQPHQVVSADLGTNELWFSEVDFETQKLKENDKMKMEDGAGPRHICFHPNNKWIYVLNELHGSVTHIELKEDGSFQALSTITTLRPAFNGNNASADIHISSDGRFVYASNRGPNDLAIFNVDEQNGSLNLLSHKSSHGNGPRNFTFSPDEAFLLVAHQYSNNICCFKRDAETGLLEFISEVGAPTPVCLMF